MQRLWHKFRKQTCLGKLGLAVGLCSIGGVAAVVLPAGAAVGVAALTAGAVGQIVGGVGGNLLSSCMDRWFPENSLDPSDKLNHDIELVVGHAVEGVMRELIKAGSPHTDLYKHLLKHDVAEGWRKVMIKHDEQTELDIPDPQALLVLAAEARETGNGDKLPPCMDADTWRKWLVRVATSDELKDSKAFGPSLDELAPALVSRFYWHLVEALKADFEQDGKAYAAIQLAATHDTLYLVRENAAQLITIGAKLDAISDKVDDKIAAFGKNLSADDWNRLEDNFDGLQAAFRNEFRHFHRHLESAIARIIEAMNNRSTPPTPLVRNALPRLPEIYVRRVAKLDALHSRISRSKSSTGTAISQVVATGFGGYGKSLLAIGYAYEFADAHFPGGAYFLPVGEVSVDVALARLGSELRLPDLPDATALAAAHVRAHLTALPGRALLIVDNVDKSQYADNAFRDGLPGGKVCLLFTTRDRGLLSPGSTVEVDRLTLDEAVELLGKCRAQALLPENRDVVLRIYNALEGIAVGIAAVGAYLGVEQALPIADYATVLEHQSPDELPDGFEDVAPQIDYRPNREPGAPSGRLVLALRDAYEAQSHAAKLVLNLATVLPQDLAPRPWIEGVLRDGIESGQLTLSTRPGYADPLVPLFHDLARGDFLRAVDPSQPVLVLHRLHRTLIRARLQQSPEVFTAMQIGLARVAHARSAEWLDGERWKEPERRWEVEPVIAFSAAFADESLTAGDASSDAVLNVASVLSDLAGRLELALGRTAGALASFDRGLRLDRKLLENNPNSRVSHRNLSVAINFKSDLERALNGPGEAVLAGYRESLGIRRRIVERFGESPEALRDVSVSLNKIADAELDLSGPGEGVLAGYGESLGICRRIVERFGESPQALRDVSVSLDNVADAELARSGPTEAVLAGYRESLGIRRRIVERFGESPQALRDVSVSLNKVADAELDLSGPGEAVLAGYRESLGIARRIVERFGKSPEALRDLGVSLERMAVTQARMGEKAKGLADAREALRLHELARDRWGANHSIDETIRKTKALIAHLEALEGPTDAVD